MKTVRSDLWRLIATALIAVAVAGVGALGSPPASAQEQATAEDERRAANRLVVEARQAYDKALAGEADAQDLLRQALDKLNEVIARYPSTDHAVTLIGGGTVAGISIPEITALLDRAQSGDAVAGETGGTEADADARERAARDDSSEDDAAEDAGATAAAPEPEPEAPPEPAGPPIPQGADAIAACDRHAGSPNDITLEGTGIWQTLIDTERAIAVCMAAVDADSENPRLKFQLGRAMYRAGRHGESVPLFTQASEAGHMVSRAQLGLMHIRGEGVAKDEAKGIALLKDAADAGDPFAIAMLGELRMRGIGLALDQEEALRLFRQAADRGSPVGMQRVGEAYASGRGLEQDSAQALEWLSKAIVAGAPGAHYMLGMLHRDGLGVKKDAAAALSHFRDAARIGHPNALFEVGAAYMNGRGVATDEAEAVRWMQQAADAGMVMSYYTLAYAHAFGRGTERNPQEAARFMFLSLRARSETAKEQMLENASQWPPDMRRALQERLKQAGLYASSIDGSFGPATRQAIQKLIGG